MENLLTQMLEELEFILATNTITPESRERVRNYRKRLTPEPQIEVILSASENTRQRKLKERREWHKKNVAFKKNIG